MRKVSLILAVFLLTVPAWATVTITCSQVGTSNNVLVSYSNDDASHKVRAFALDITVTNGIITDVNDKVNAYYTIYPGSIVIEGNAVANKGHAVADYNDLPSDTKGGIGTSGVTIEMGALYPPKDNNTPPSPPQSGNLLRFTCTGTGNSVVTIAKNGSRGGVVMTDPNLTPAFVSSGCTILRECFPSCRSAEYTRWSSAAVNKPPCWCYKRQCHGDADNQSEYIKGKGYYYAHYKDMSLLLSAWNVREPPQGTGMAWPNTFICADFDRGDPEYIKGKGYYRVHYKDMSILLGIWNVREPPNGSGLPQDCLNCP